MTSQAFGHYVTIYSEFTSHYTCFTDHALSRQSLACGDNNRLCCRCCESHDSLYYSLDKATHDLIIKLFPADISMNMEECPKQYGVKDCSVFAITYATLLAAGGNPSTTVFNQHDIREHLLKCFEAFCLIHSPCSQHNFIKYVLTVYTMHRCTFTRYFFYTYYA